MPAILRKSLPKRVASLCNIGSYAGIEPIQGHGDHLGSMSVWNTMRCHTMCRYRGCHCSTGGGGVCAGWAVSHIHAIEIKSHVTVSRITLYISRGR